MVSSRLPDSELCTSKDRGERQQKGFGLPQGALSVGEGVPAHIAQDLDPERSSIVQ